MLARIEADDDPSWTRQDFEDEGSWRAFVAYRDQAGPRTLLETARATGDSIARLRAWRDEHGWRLRVLEYDRWLDARRTAHVSAMINEDALQRASRHVAALRGMHEVVSASIREWMSTIRVTERGVIQRPKDAMTILKGVIEYERLIAGEFTGGEKESELDLSALSVEEVDQLRSLIAKARRST